MGLVIIMSTVNLFILISLLIIIAPATYYLKKAKGLGIIRLNKDLFGPGKNEETKSFFLAEFLMDLGVIYSIIFFVGLSLLWFNALIHGQV